MSTAATTPDPAPAVPFAATMTRCRHGQALVVLESGPFNGYEVRPPALRQMAQQLLALADMAGQLPTGGKHWRATRVQMGTAQPATEAGQAEKSQPDESPAKASNAEIAAQFNDIFKGRK